MSRTMVVAPIVAALVKSEKILGANRMWRAMSPEQERFLQEYFSQRTELARFSDQELRSWTSFAASQLNAILKQEGFDIQLQDFLPDEFGVVSTLDVLVEWLVEGQESTLSSNGVKYHAVHMESRAEVDGIYTSSLFEAYHSSVHTSPVALVSTKSGDKVYMTVAGAPPYDDFDVINRVNAIRTTLERAHTHYDWLEFPMVDLDQKVDISWLRGMRTLSDKGDPALISQALQQTKFKMNERGAHVKSAVAIGIRVTSLKRNLPLIIDQPFFLWIERQGVSTPILCAYLTQENWKNPGSLDM